MKRTASALPDHVIVGPDGYVLAPTDLPPPGTIRWVARRKAEVVIAVSGGLISMRDACKRYGLSPDEFAAWEVAYTAGGLAGLRATPKTAVRAQNSKDFYGEDFSGG